MFINNRKLMSKQRSTASTMASILRLCQADAGAAIISTAATRCYADISSPYLRENNRASRGRRIVLKPAIFMTASAPIVGECQNSYKAAMRAKPASLAAALSPPTS